jgi:nicotinate-nucleotide pyrophosphorylase (carboxylating)
VYLTTAAQKLIRLALDEDVGRGDCTSEALFGLEETATAVVRIKESSRVAGLPVVKAVFAALDAQVKVSAHAEDGTEVQAGAAVCEMRGPALSILAGERTALNFLARLTGVATLTREAVRRLDGTSTRLLDTRKTTPGWRDLEKYAVRVGGGHNHRRGLDDMVLIKDNHIALAGGVAQAVAKVRAAVAPARVIEVEVDTLAQLQEALDSGADMILLDNMDLESLHRAVGLTGGRVPLEASGNMTLERLPAVARTGVDYISMGALTHSAVSVDVGLDIQ